MRKGQVTVFIILSLALLFLLLFLLKQIEPAANIAYDSDAKTQIESLTTSCLEKTLQEGLYRLGMQGGYVYNEVFPGYLPYNKWLIELDYYLGYDFLPTIDEMEQVQLGPYIQNNILKCTDNYKGIVGAQLSVGVPYANVTILDKEVLVRLEMPITIVELDKQTKVGPFATSVRSNLKEMRETADELIIQQIRDPGNIHLSLLSNLPYEPRVIIVYPDTHITEMIDRDNLYRGTPYVFRYASLFGNNTPPQLYLPGEIDIKAGEEYQLTAEDREGDKIEFYSSNEQTFVTPDGRLSAPVGNYDTIIYAYDTNGLYSQYDVKVIVR